MAALTDAMEDLAALIATGTDRPVTTDPRNVVAPCVLVEPPGIRPDGVQCGAALYTFNVIVLGLPGARAELDPLAELLAEVLATLNRADVAWTEAAFGFYVPLVSTGGADPSMSYTVTVEVYS